MVLSLVILFFYGTTFACIQDVAKSEAETKVQQVLTENQSCNFNRIEPTASTSGAGGFLVVFWCSERAALGTPGFQYVVDVTNQSNQCLIGDPRKVPHSHIKFNEAGLKIPVQDSVRQQNKIIGVD